LKRIEQIAFGLRVLDRIHMKKTVKFFVKLGTTDAEPFEVLPNVSELPPGFTAAKACAGADQKKAIAAIKKFLKCSFEPSNIEADLKEVMTNPVQMEAKKVELLWIDYTSDTLPVVSAEATFEMDFVEGLTAEALEEWQQENDSLDNGFGFYWDLHQEKVGKYFILWTNSGCFAEVF
jgi:hypothetical protein